MPADCSGTTDTAWKYTYDADGNRLSQTDSRNQSRYTTYDALDRPLCSALSAADASSCTGTTDEATFYDGYSNASTPGGNLPIGVYRPNGQLRLRSDRAQDGGTVRGHKRRGIRLALLRLRSARADRPEHPLSDDPRRRDYYSDSQHALQRRGTGHRSGLSRRGDADLDL
jgi:YD repeat-containing protein